MPRGRGDGRRPETGGRKGFLLRLPPSMLEELRTWAEQDLRSLNGQIEFLLREALARRRRRGGGDPPS